MVNTKLSSCQKNKSIDQFMDQFSRVLPAGYLDHVDVMTPLKNNIKAIIGQYPGDNFEWLVPLYSSCASEALELYKDFLGVGNYNTSFEEYYTMLGCKPQLNIPGVELIIPFGNRDGKIMCFDYRYNDNPVIVSMLHCLAGSEEELRDCPMVLVARNFDELLDRSDPNRYQFYITSDLLITDKEYIDLVGEFYFEHHRDNIEYTRKSYNVVL